MVILSSWYFMNQKKTYNVSAENIQTDQVTEGKFEDMLMVTAQTQSLNSSLVNVLEGGAVKEIFCRRRANAYQRPTDCKSI
jgi:HlyD family secretion protein